MGSVPNVGRRAQKAEEYGSHDKTFRIPADGTVRVLDEAGHARMTHDVHAGDIWRMCQAKDAPIRDWVKLAVSRARQNSTPAVFWRGPPRAHDANDARKATDYRKDNDPEALQIRKLAPGHALAHAPRPTQ